MIEIRCGCAAPRHVPESAVGRRFRCPACARVIQIACAEQLAEGGGAGDFDTALVVTAGPELLDTHVLVGGVADLTIGKQPGCNVLLPGGMVSRVHAKLQRVDFGPSRWKIVDNHSTNGLFVNHERVTEHELRNGDVVAIGEFNLQFIHLGPEEKLELVPSGAPPSAFGSPSSPPFASAGQPAYAPAAAWTAGASPSSAIESPVAAALRGPTCPSCERTLPGGAKICVGCGINVATGRPVLTSQGVDEDSLYESAQRWIWWVSWLVWITPMPIPIRSEAFGTRKPYAIWTIAAATVLASVTFFLAQSVGGANENDRPGKELMLWAPRGSSGVSPAAFALDSHKSREIARGLTDEQREAVRDLADDRDGTLSEDERFERGLAAYLALESAALRGEFHWYQLITHAFLHDTSSVYNFAMHLAGNMMFLLVFGTRVNALIGNIATAVLYPVLAVAAAGVHLASLGDAPPVPMLGASGAIMGLAGMYLILFPAHQVFCAMWISLWLRFRRIYGCKIFPLRGFWVLLIYFGYDVLMNYISSHFGFGEGVAHWAHIGGFLTGMALALGVLFSRQFNTHGGDVLSVTLGRHAWPLIGKPGRWSRPALPPLAAPAAA